MKRTSIFDLQGDTPQKVSVPEKTALPHKQFKTRLKNKDIDKLSPLKNVLR